MYGRKRKAEMCSTQNPKVAQYLRLLYRQCPLLSDVFQFRSLHHMDELATMNITIYI